jgi:hypothetical protein
MQPENKEIVERTLGCNNFEMWKKCELLKEVVTQTIETKEGRGKNVRLYQKYKHNTPKEIIDKIIYSCEYYKSLHEKDMENKKIGSLEIVKYRFEKINGDPKIIIDMVKVLDTNGVYIKFAKLEGVTKYLSKYPITFKEL